jgi:outer membrane lipoprotein carrier protein
VWLKKPGKMRWDYQNRRTGEVNKSFISDGSRLWALEHDNKQAFRKDLEDTVLPVAVTFLTGQGELMRDFRPALDRSGTYGAPSDYVLRLVPRRPSAQYKTLWLVVDPEDFRVKQSIVLEASGNTNHFRFFEPDTNRPVRDSWFEVDPNALRGYRIIDPE